MSTSGGSSGGGLSVATATLDGAAIRTLNSAPTQLIAAPGAGLALNVVQLAFQIVVTNGSFLFMGSPGVYYAGLLDSVLGVDVGALGNLLTEIPLVAGTIQAAAFASASDPIPVASIANKAVVVGATDSDATSTGPIVTKTIADGGLGYAVGDTGTIGPDPQSSDGTATYLVTAVTPVTGVVTAFTVTAPGANYSTISNPLPTAVGGAQPGGGAGFTVNVTAVTAAVASLYVTAWYQTFTTH